MPGLPLPADDTSPGGGPGGRQETRTSAFYVVGNSRHFLGLVALVNSLRLVGHNEPIFVADCGLSEADRQRLAGEVTIVKVSAHGAPHLAKAVVPLASPSDVMVLVDADIIVTRSLKELIDTARSGRIVAFADAVAHRFDKSWSALLGLGELRRQPYVNAGLVAIPGSFGAPVLAQVAAGCAQIDVEHTIVGSGSPAYPFYYLDQDVLNAVLASRAPEQLKVLEHALAPFPPFRGVHLDDETRLRCCYQDGREPFALHHVLRKPWLAPTRRNIYSQLLCRLLLWPDLAIPLRDEDVPQRFRSGGRAWLENRRVDAVCLLEDIRSRIRLRRSQPKRENPRAVV